MLKLSAQWRNRNAEIAAIDLGSNSFHMIIARIANGQLTVIDRLKESVRLGYGLTNDDVLDELSQKRAFDCLQRFHQRVRHLHPDHVRAVGTRALRQAKNAFQFLRRAEQALGFDIQIISGAEEARLVYQGVAFGLEEDNETRLVIDIGGGSTELIIGQNFSPKILESLGMGCVALTRRFFADGEISAQAVRQADIYCQQKLEPLQNNFRRQAWQRAIGCSGTIKSVAKVVEASFGHSHIHQDSAAALLEKCLQCGRIDALDLPGLSTDRRPIFLAGLIVLLSCMRALAIESLEASPWALREGVLCDLLGYDSVSDLRERSVDELARRFHVDMDHAQRTDAVAQALFSQANNHQQLANSWRRYLAWACRLREVGLDINHDRFHCHGGYIIAHSHLAGFGYDEQRQLAFLVSNQRKKPDWSQLESIAETERNALTQLLHIYRLACVLTRARNDIGKSAWSLRLANKTFCFQAAASWWQTQPLAAADLWAEVNYLKKSPYGFTLNHEKK